MPATLGLMHMHGQNADIYMHICFFAQLYVLTHVEGLQLWDFGAESRLVKVDDLRPSLSAASPGLEIDYCEFIYICMYVCMYVCMCVRMCVCMYVYMYICTILARSRDW